MTVSSTVARTGIPTWFTATNPLVRSHPVTGRKALFGAADTGIGIVGMSDEEARPLLDEFANHATQPRLAYLHRYRINDVVIWNNAQLLHCAERLQRPDRPDRQRIMHRVSVRGWPQPAAGPNGSGAWRPEAATRAFHGA